MLVVRRYIQPWAHFISISYALFRSTRVWLGRKQCDYIPAATTNAFAIIVVEFILCNCKRYCKKSCSCHSNGQDCIKMCGCSEFCQNIDPSLPRTVLEEDLQL